MATRRDTAKHRHQPRINLDGGQARHNGRPLGRVIDLSTAGVFIESHLRLQPGQEVRVRFEIPDPQHQGQRVAVEALGEVRHQQRQTRRGVGIRFLRLEGADAAAIQAAIDARIASDRIDAANEFDIDVLSDPDAELPD